MTLKDKLEVEIMHLPLTDDVINAIGIELEQIAESFAIGFGEWILVNRFEMRDDNHKDWWGKLNEEKDYNTKELLEIYKKHYESNIRI
jgi:hypothetical protein